MIEFLIYLAVVIATYRFAYSRTYDTYMEDWYNTEGDFRLGIATYSLLWFISIPLTIIWKAFGLLSPKSPGQKAKDLADQIIAEKREIFRLRVHRADLEHENGLEPSDPPDGWVPKGDRWRHHLDAKL